MLSFLHSLSPVPSFPAYAGPYSVGTRELEIPTSELRSLPSPADPSITTISGRIFYPCERPSPKTNHKPVSWLPEPQIEYFTAYARFMRASPWLASLLSYFPLIRPLFHTTIPALSHAPLLPPPSPTSATSVTNAPGRYPVLIFSHGLGGSKNAYSFLLTSLASHGLVVFALEHRDGSAPVSFIRTEAGTFKDAKRVESLRLGFRGGKEVEEGRDRQLRVRCWEMAGAYEGLCMIDGGGRGVTNLAAGDVGESESAGVSGLEGFRGRLDVSTPGKVAWAGHSFGATTVVQFVKSVFYHHDGDSEGFLHAGQGLSPALRRQITPASPTIFLDLWAQPLWWSATRALGGMPLPCYDENPSASASAPLAILSESFFKWKENLQDTVRAISVPGSTDSSTNTNGVSPHIFYPVHSAHLSQSDFGSLFPWFTKRVFKAEEPARTILLNVRAILEVLRRAGVGVADTSAVDMEVLEQGDKMADGTRKEGLAQGRFSDRSILDTAEGRVRGWVAVQPRSRGEIEVLDTGNAAAEAAAAEIPKSDGGTPDSGYDSPGTTPAEAMIQGEVMKD